WSVLSVCAFDSLQSLSPTPFLELSYCSLCLRSRSPTQPPSHLPRALAHGHGLQVVVPAEETFPYSGRVEFIEPEGGESITAGRAEAWKADYEARVARHRGEIRAATDKLGWRFAIHRTDRPATELLLALDARMSAPPPGGVV